MPSDSEYLSPGEVARILHVSPKTVSRWADSGWLSCIMTLGGHRRFPRHEIEELEQRLARAPSGRSAKGPGPRKGGDSS